MPQTFDPNQKVSPQAWQRMMRQTTLTFPMMPLLLGWESLTDKPTPGFARTRAVLAAVADLMGDEPVAGLRAGVDAGDPRALAAVEQLAPLFNPVALTRREDCAALRDSGRFQDLIGEAGLLGLAAEAAGNQDFVLDALFLQAVARRALQDARGAIAAYRTVLEKAGPDKSEFRSAAHDNLANILLDIGDYDGAIENYNRADAEAQTPDERFSIVLNRARLHNQLGELADANEDLRQAEEWLKSMQPPAPDRNWGCLYDFKAQIRHDEGKLTEALALALQGRTLLQEAPPRERAVNAMIRARLHHRLAQDDAAEAVFDEALALADAQAAAAIDGNFYRAGYANASARRLPPSDEAFQHVVEAVHFAEKGDLDRAKVCFSAAMQRARQLKDVMTGLRVQMNVVALLLDYGEIAEAVELAENLRQQAMRNGLAYLEASAMVNLASASDDGADSGFDSLMGYARARRLFALHRAIVAEAKTEAVEAAQGIAGNGVLENQLAKLAEKVGAYRRALVFARDSYDLIAKIAPNDWRVCNRLAGLLGLYRKLGQTLDAEATVERLSARTADNGLSARGKLVANHALGDRFLLDQPARAEGFIKAAFDAAEQIRGQQPDVSQRAVADRQYHDLYPKYAMLLRKAGKTVEALETLQFGKGRALLDAALARGAGDGRPPKLGQIQAALAPGETLVDFAVEGDGLAAYVVTAHGVEALSSRGDLAALEAADLGDLRTRAAGLLRLCRENPLLLDLVGQVAALIPSGSRVLIAPDLGLHNLPLHVTPVGGKPFCAQSSIGYLPAAAALLPRGEKAATARAVFVAGNSRCDLQGAESECRAVAAIHGVSVLTGRACTRAALEAALDSGPLDIVHLAVHGRGNPRRGGQSSLIMAKEGGGTELVDLDRLAERPWPVNLVVLSGCSTGLGGPRNGYELVSVAGRILQAGARAVVASLWPVGDENAKTAMVAFHTALKSAQTGERDYRIALDAARSALSANSALCASRLRDGRDIAPESGGGDFLASASAQDAATLDWASFILVGDPKF